MCAEVNRRGRRRRYDASGRRARAERTRDEIVAAARVLFERDGHAATTIAGVARAANVSPETVYRAFGSKSGLLGAVIRTAVRGDAGPAPLRERRQIDAIRRETDPRRQFELYGRLLATVNPRLVPLLRVMRQAADGDPEIAAAVAQLNADRLDGMAEFAGLLGQRGALAAGVSMAEARDVLWTLNSPELYELLVLGRGWSARRYGGWVAGQLAGALLDEPSAKSGSSRSSRSSG